MSADPSELPGPCATDRCPLCGQGNACAMATAGADAGQPCWCVGVNFEQALLDRIPAADRNRVCVCAACATAARASCQETG